MAIATEPEIGDPAPDFTLLDQTGATVSLADFAGRKLLLYFYPKADTPGCTTQARAVHDAKHDLEALDAQVVGISPDPIDDQRTFDEKYALGFPLLSDRDHAVAEAYGAWGIKKLYGREYEGVIRSSFLVDEQGRIAGAWPKVTPKETVPKALDRLRELTTGD
ncbi:MAG: thioredoxin-dependent thiol peroxidase [Actinomycetota bacterium]